jgi:hypothetical protein
MVRDELQTILDHSSGERKLCAFLKKHPWVLLHSMTAIGDASGLIAEFPLGNQFKVDFLILAPFSGSFELRLIEIEPPDAKIFNSDGTLAKRANKALEQVNSWQQHIKKNRASFLRDLSRYATSHDLVRERNSEPTCHVGWPLYHPKMALIINYDIIIGRRRDLNDRQIELKAEFKENRGVQIATCDRLLRGAEEIDRHARDFNT